jgi:aspartate/methionine/tyrosine aminotransferase
MTISELLDMAQLPRDTLQTLHLGYTETWGAPDLREAISETYAHMGPENILCFAGAEEGVYAAMRVLLSPQDHAIVVVPNYQAAETLPLEICAVTGVLLAADDGWSLNLEDVRAAIKPNTKLISVCFPNNPTGKIIPADDYRELIELCRAHDLYLFSDEVYRRLELDETKRIDQAADAYEKGISLNVMSKAYGLPGLRIGWIAAQDKTLLQKLERYKHYLSICNSAPSERLAVIALGAAEKILSKNRALMTRNLVKLDSFFADYPDLFDWSHPDGGCIAYPKYKGVGGVNAFCEALVEENGVLLLPATIYRSELMETPVNHFRIGFGRANMDAGLSAFRAFMDRKYSALTP